MSHLNNYLRLYVLAVLSSLCPNLRLCITLQSFITLRVPDALSERCQDVHPKHGHRITSKFKHKEGKSSKTKCVAITKRFCLTFMLFLKENFQFFIDIVFLFSPVFRSYSVRVCNAPLFFIFLTAHHALVKAIMRPYKRIIQ